MFLRAPAALIKTSLSLDEQEITGGMRDGTGCGTWKAAGLALGLGLSLGRAVCLRPYVKGQAESWPGPGPSRAGQKQDTVVMSSQIESSSGCRAPGEEQSLSWHLALQVPCSPGRSGQGSKGLSKSPGPGITCSETWNTCFQPQLCHPKSMDYNPCLVFS